MKPQFILNLILISVFASGCNLPFLKKDENSPEIAPVPNQSNQKGLYVASGACYAGGVATSSPSNQILKFSTSTGAYLKTVMDYRTQSPGDSPVGMVKHASDTILSLVENTNGRHIDEVNTSRDGGSIYLLNAALTAVLRGIKKTSDDSILITKSTAVEKFTAFRTRVTQGTAAFINNPAGACSGMNTALTFAIELSSGNILIGSAAASPNNKIALIKSTGYAVLADCLSSRVAPATGALPSAAVAVSDDTFLVAFAGPLPSSNVIVAYKIDTSTDTNLANATVTTVLSDPSLMMGVSAMAFDPDEQALYVASSPANSEKIEKFKWDPITNTLQRTGSSPFLVSSELSCVSSMMVSD